MIRLIAITGFALAIATSAQGISLCQFISRTAWSHKSAKPAARVGYE